MPAKWIPCGNDFMVGDVLRWTEPVWKPKARKNSRTKVIGHRVVTAQVAEIDGDWLHLTLKSCETTNAEDWWKRIPEPKSGQPLRRQRRALAKKHPERRPWGGADGEAARREAGGTPRPGASKFLT